jgi:hypothetical protein
MSIFPTNCMPVSGSGRPWTVAVPTIPLEQYATLTFLLSCLLCSLRVASDGSGGELIYAPLDASGLQRAAAELESIRVEAAGPL